MLMDTHKQQMQHGLDIVLNVCIMSLFPFPHFPKWVKTLGDSLLLGHISCGKGGLQFCYMYLFKETFNSSSEDMAIYGAAFQAALISCCHHQK